ncbi:MAG: aminomethyl-transferring glycine dehydrogenase subunit GcvPB [Deltaproteobacteria bacterium]|nr:aminomethyl-transferring glycine dehydrogenase subunit GcvPB [Deltaproteobacteria bacterium]
MNKPIIKEKVIMEYHTEAGSTDAQSYAVPSDIPKSYLRDDIEGMPDLSEPEVVRHFTRLSYMNHSLDSGMYPLGSCTMKYNPKLMEKAANYDGFSLLHPLVPGHMTQGIVKLLYNTEQYLKTVTGMDAFSLQLAAGAHGELAGMLMAAKYHKVNKTNKHTIIIPDTAHGTNPASAAMAGFKVLNIPSGSHGMIEADMLRPFINDDIAGIMLTVPNTLGIFESQIVEIAKLIHDAGGLVYIDGANFNALLGKARYGDMGADIVHLNLHKTFATPHGSGGPGAGVIGVASRLREFLPVPVVAKKGSDFVLEYSVRNTIGRMIGFYGNIGIIVRAYTYMRMLGIEGAKEVSAFATLNANYIRAMLKDVYNLPYSTQTLHEVVFNDAYQNQNGVKTIDIAKRLIDFGFHPPTIYFPLIVHGAIMIEPTETESKDEIDRFIAAMKTIAEECKTDPQVVLNAPHTTPVRRVDEVKAAREPRLVYTKPV